MTRTNKLALAAAVVAASLSLQGCIVVADGDGVREWDNLAQHERVERDNRRVIASLTEGDALAPIQAELGTPNFSELVVDNGTRYRVLYYRTHRVTADGETTKDECTPLVFRDDQLIGTGELALRQVPLAN